MDIKPIIARMASDCDMRCRFLKHLPGLLDRYFLSPDGKITCEPTMSTSTKTPRPFIAGLAVKINL